MPTVQVLVGPQEATIPQSGTQQFKAIAVDNQGDTVDVTATAVWASTEPDIATVDAAGLATGVTVGATTITAVYDGKTGSAALGVEVALVSLEIAPVNVVLQAGQTQQFTATGHYSDGGTENLTAAAAFSTTDPDVATVNNTGLAKGIAAGVAVIAARYGSLTAPTSVGVMAQAANPYAELLAQAQAQLLKLVAGQAVVSIETPQLGRVVYNQANIADLQRLIDNLRVLANPAAAAALRRRPISVEACP